MNKQSLASQSSGKYELTVVLDGKATAAKKKKITEFIQKAVSLSKGKIEKTDEWGVLDLAYKIGKSGTGVFLHFLLELERSVVKNLTAKLGQEDEIIRHLIVWRGV